MKKYTFVFLFLSLRKIRLWVLSSSLSALLWSACSSTSSLLHQSGGEVRTSIDAIANTSRSKTLRQITLSDDEALEIGYKIWKNECGGSIEGLTAWNKGEEFASLGIGHFIWFPEGCKSPFGESFPNLIDALLVHEQGMHYVPDWLKNAFARGKRSCPWKTREEFRMALHSEEMRELRRMLASTVSIQSRYIANRLESSLPKILSAAPEEDRERIQAQFYRVAFAPMGLYVLADYVNFKGEGIRTSEHYGHRGWGLLQVLQGMSGKEEGKAALWEFAASAEARLIERIEHAPPERKEHHWLPGWKRRLKTYCMK